MNIITETIDTIEGNISSILRRNQRVDGRAIVEVNKSARALKKNIPVVSGAEAVAKGALRKYVELESEADMFIRMADVASSEGNQAKAEEYLMKANTLISVNDKTRECVAIACNESAKAGASVNNDLLQLEIKRMQRDSIVGMSMLTDSLKKVNDSRLKDLTCERREFNELWHKAYTDFTRQEIIADHLNGIGLEADDLHYRALAMRNKIEAPDTASVNGTNDGGVNADITDTNVVGEITGE